MTGTGTGTALPEDALRAAAEAWLRQDPDPETRQELTGLLTALTATDPAGRSAALTELRDRFESRLAFGTAGLRGPLGAGPNRMNRVVVAQTTAGLLQYLRNRTDSPRVVVGYDGRKNSAVFATDAAGILAGSGARVTLLPRALPTPVLAFAVRHLKASAGVMITASHNPAADNGYKLYLGGESRGSQLVSPADTDMLAFINQIVREKTVDQLRRSDDYTIADESILERYIELTASILGIPPGPLNWVYTPLHGVGWETAARVFAAAGLPEPHVVEQQRDPDPEFPTVAFPNPEEDGALDLAIATAGRVGAELIVANDPDADRLAVAVVDNGVWRRMSGNELGMLLGWGIAQRHQREGRPGNFATSIVSTPALRVIAERHGFGYVETLTGFKWISRVPDLLFGFEEALGYLVDPWKVRDKDGISAALAAVEGIYTLRAQGKTLADFAADFDDTFGHFASEQLSLRVPRIADTALIMQRLRAAPPRLVGGIAVRGVDDLIAGSADLPPSDVLRFRLDEGARLIVRPSGTEPKLKAYLDVHAAAGSVAEKRQRAGEVLGRLVAALPELLG